MYDLNFNHRIEYNELVKYHRFAAKKAQFDLYLENPKIF